MLEHDGTERNPYIPHQCHYWPEPHRRCGSYAMHNEYFCYHHRMNPSTTIVPDDEFELPPLTDRESAQKNLAIVAQHLAKKTIDDRRARVLLYNIQLFLSSLKPHPHVSVAIAARTTLPPAPAEDSPQPPESSPDPGQFESSSSLTSATPGQTTTVLASIHASAETPPSPSDYPGLTPALVSRIFPYTPPANIAANLPHVLTALTAASLTDTPMLLAALATIRAEAEPFLPLTEEPSALNTAPGGPPFGLYDHRADLGNRGPTDGADFRGRGYIQLTGRDNYARLGAESGHPLLQQPALAASPAIAAELLARFLAHKADRIRAALASGDLAIARRLVNGGANGLSRFIAAYQTGLNLLAGPVTASPPAQS